MGRLEETIVLRLPDASTERAERLVPAVSADPQFAAMGKVKKSMVFRLAILEGLKVLEKRYHPKPRKKSKR